MAQLLVALWYRPNAYGSSSAMMELDAALQAVHRVTVNPATEFPGQFTGWRQGSRIKSIFVAPEYLFTESGNTLRSPIDQDAKDLIRTQLCALSVNAPETLVFPGTVFWSKPVTRKPEENYKKNVHGTRDMNDAASLKTQSRQFKATQAMHQVSALYTRMGLPPPPVTPPSATQSILRNTCYVLKDGEVIHKYNKQCDANENITGNANFVFVPGESNGLLDYDGISFGIEICLDHGTSTMVHFVLNNNRAPNIQVICSDWVQYNPLASIASHYCAHASTNPTECGILAFNNRTLPTGPVFRTVNTVPGSLIYHLIDDPRGP